MTYFRHIIFIITLLYSTQVFGLENGADRLNVIVPQLQNKNIGIVVNQTSTTQEQLHVLDALLALEVNVTKIFTPEHGFRGDADAGELIDNSKDARSGLPIISLYGSNKRPSEDQLRDIDVIIFDIQDVGARFYTYISTLHYVMQACTPLGIEVIVLDRPNPNDYVQGPVLVNKFKSFIGVLPLPVLHGLTMGELARMINGERWDDVNVKLTIVPVLGWSHGEPYSLPIKPSPNLPNDQAIALYPSLCLFEATKISVGRGTQSPFQILGYPDARYGEFLFTPQPLVGFDKNPLQNGQKCYGVDLREVSAPKGFSLGYFMEFMKISGKGINIISSTDLFDKLTGDDSVRRMLSEGKSEAEIAASWEQKLNTYKIMRKKYLLYNDYE